MPGNEVGDKVHNFFGQENLSQGQHHLQAVDGNWPGLSNNLWVGSQRQIGAPLISNLKNFNVQLSDSERGHGGRSSHMPHGLNFTQSTLRPEFGRSQPQNQHPNFNGYVHGHQVLQARHSEAKILGVDAESDRHNLTSRGLSILESQLGNGPELHKKNSSRLETAESPVNYDFFGGQQQMSSQHSTMLQSLPRQQSGIADMQLLQQEVMLKQMQELQREKQPQQEGRQPGSLNQVPGSLNQVPFIAKQSAGNHSPALINGIPIHDASNYSWQPEFVVADTNWLQHGASPVMQASSSGLMRTMGLVPQQSDQSLYGVPISSTRGSPSLYNQDQMDKPVMPCMLASSNSLPGNQYVTFPDQVSMRDRTLVSRHGFQGKNMFSPAASQVLNGGLNFENLQQMNPQHSAPMQEFRARQQLPGASETSLEKTMTQVAPSQNVATLDPTEEKILFGSDDSVWDAFGRNNIGTGGYNMLDCDPFGAFPSMQSGSWSALMQSAVAETSSGDVGIQEEWSGLNFRNTEAPTGNQQPSTVNDSSKRQSIWEDTNLQTVSTLPSRPFPVSDDATTSINDCMVSRVQQSRPKTLHEQNERLQRDPSQRFIIQFPEEGSNWVDCGPLQRPLAEGSNIYENISHSSDAELNVKSISGSLINQESVSLYNTGSQPCNRPNGWNSVESISGSGGATLKNHEKENSLRRPWSSDDKRAVLEKMGQSSQQLPSSHNLNFWKHIDSLGKSKGIEVPGNYQHHLDKGPQNLESSGNNDQDKGAVEMHEMDNSDKRENSSDSFRSNVSRRAWLDASGSSTLPGFKEESPGHVGRRPVTRKFQYHPMGDLDVDVEPSYGTKHVPHSQAMLQQQVSQGLKVHDEGYLRQLKFVGHTGRNSVEMDKGDAKGLDELPSKSMLPGYVPNLTAPFNRSVGTYVPNQTGPSSQNMLELLHKVDQSSESAAIPNSSSDRNLSSEMPETENFDGSVGHLQRNQSTISQGFGLQLGPPSQWLPVVDQVLSSQSSSQTANSLSSTHITSEIGGEKGRTWVVPTSSPHSLPPNLETSQGEVGNNISVSLGQTGNKALHYNAQANFSYAFTPGFSYSRSHLTDQHMTSASGQATINRSPNISSDRLSTSSKQIDDSCERAQPSQSARASLADLSGNTPHSDSISLADMSQLSGTNQNHSRDSSQKALEAVPVSQPSLKSGVSQRGAFSRMLPNAWTSVSSQSHFLGTQLGRGSSNLFKSHIQSNNNAEMTSTGPTMVGDQDAHKGRIFPSDFDSGNSQGFIREDIIRKKQPVKESPWQQVSPENNELVQKPKNGPVGKESVGKHLADASYLNTATTQRDIEAFGRSLRPNNNLNHNSFLHQVKAVKNVEIDPTNRSVKRFKGAGGGLDTQQVSSKGGQQLSHGYNTMVRDASINHTSVPSGDSNMLSISSKLVENQDTNIPSQGMLAYAQNDSQKISSSNSEASVRGEQPHISPQMAPSWFDQYGTFKNGQMLPTYDAQKITTVKTTEQPCIVAKPSDSLHPCNSMEQANAVVDASQLGNHQQNSTTMAIGSENLSSPYSLPSDVIDPRVVVVRPKKHKSATCELLPWHKEVTKDFRRLHNISMAEMDWAQAANRLIEMVEDEAVMIDDGPPVLGTKKRLILTTQLMQQLLRPPPKVVLSADASSHYESVAYSVARSALGDACSTISASKIDTYGPSDGGNLLSKKHKTSVRNDYQYFSEVTEELISRARNLENVLLRLDKRTSILGLRVECQDLEKFSVINRFAKFHGRGQADGAETSLSSDATANAQKSYPQRYVIALPMPRNFPDRVKCLPI